MEGQDFSYLHSIVAFYALIQEPDAKPRGTCVRLSPSAIAQPTLSPLVIMLRHDLVLDPQSDRAHGLLEDVLAVSARRSIQPGVVVIERDIGAVLPSARVLELPV